MRMRLQFWEKLLQSRRVFLHLGLFSLSLFRFLNAASASHFCQRQYQYFRCGGVLNWRGLAGHLSSSFIGAHRYDMGAICLCDCLDNRCRAPSLSSLLVRFDAVQLLIDKNPNTKNSRKKHSTWPAVPASWNPGRVRRLTRVNNPIFVVAQQRCSLFHKQPFQCLLLPPQ